MNAPLGGYAPPASTVEYRLSSRFLWGRCLSLASLLVMLVSALRPLGNLDLGTDGYWTISAWRGVGGALWSGSWLVPCAGCAVVIQAGELCRGLLLPKRSDLGDVPVGDDIRLSLGMVIMHTALAVFAPLVVWSIADAPDAHLVTIRGSAWVSMVAAAMGLIGSLVTWGQPARVVNPGPLAQLASAPA